MTNIPELLEAVRRFKTELARFESELKRQQALAAQEEGPATVYQPPVEHWFTSAGEGCITYGAEDAASEARDG